MITVGWREQHSVPRNHQEALTKASGLNRFGEPKMRLTWGWSRMDWLYNLKNRSYGLVPKYIVRPSRFYVEQWLPSERYGTPDTWHATTTDREDSRNFYLCGPFPSRGDYEMLLMLETPHRRGCESVAVSEYDGCPSCGGGRFLDLNRFVSDNVCRIAERSRDVSERDRLNYTRSLMDGWYRDYDRDADDIIKEFQPNFNGQPTVFHSSVKSKFDR